MDLLNLMVLNKYGMTTTKSDLNERNIRMGLRYFANRGDYLIGPVNIRKAQRDIAELIRMKAGQIVVKNSEKFCKEFALSKDGKTIPSWLLEMIYLEIEDLSEKKKYDFYFRCKLVDEIDMMVAEMNTFHRDEIGDFFPEARLQSMFGEDKKTIENAVYLYLNNLLAELNTSEEKGKIREKMNKLMMAHLNYVIEREKKIT